MNIDYSNKELVRSYHLSDFKEPRTYQTEEIINGRTYIKTGRYCATAFVAEVWDLHSSSDEQFNYVMHIGMSRQHPNEYMATNSQGIEIAAERAMMDPIAIIKFICLPSWDDFANIARSLMNNVPCEFIRTSEEREIAEDRKAYEEERKRYASEATCGK